MNIKNFNMFNIPNQKIKLISLALSGTLMATALSSCKNKEDSFNREMLLTENNVTYLMEFTNYIRYSDGWIEVRLADGSSVLTNEKNIVTFEKRSEIMDILSKQEEIVTIDTYGADTNLKKHDAMLLPVAGESLFLKIDGYTRNSDGWISIYLADGTKINTNETNIVIFNSNSKMMEQITGEKNQTLKLIP